MPLDDWTTGYVIADRFRLEERLGRGGMGSVWKAHHLTLDSPVAVKLIDPLIAEEEVALKRFMREAKAAAALRGAHVIQTFDYGVHDDVPYIVMELLEGESLGERLEREGTLEPEELLRVMTHVGRAVAKAHDVGTVHRDLKPDNIFITQNDDEEVCKVLDFGIAKTAKSNLELSKDTATGTMVGTPFYMSPEQSQGTADVDFKTDLWAMGVIAYQCLVGERPFESAALGELLLRICVDPVPVPSEHGGVPEEFDAWFARAVERNPAHRFGSAKEMVEALRRVVEGSATEPGSEEAVESADSQADDEHVQVAAADTRRAASDSHASLSRTTADTATAPAPPSRRWLAVGALAVGAIAIAAWRLGAKSPDESSEPAATTEPSSQATAEPSTEPGPPEPTVSAALEEGDAAAAREPTALPKRSPRAPARSPKGPVKKSDPAASAQPEGPVEPEGKKPESAIPEDERDLGF